VKILVRATNWVGDAILSLPALRALRSAFPAAHISILARPYVIELYLGQGIADALLSYDWRAEHAGLRGRERLAGELRTHRFDTAILFQNAFDAAWVAWRARIPQRIGYARDARSALLTKAVRVPKPDETPAHEQFYYLELLRRAGWIDKYPAATCIALRIDPQDAETAEGTLLLAGARPGKLRIAIGAGASYGSAKCWPPTRFAEVANRLQANLDADVILFGAAGEADVSQAIASAMRHRPIDLTGKTAIADLPALLSQCHLFIGNDSGAMHVAAAVGLAIVAIFGPTDPAGTAPVTSRCTIVQEKPHCSPCFLRRCPIDHRCMKRVTPEAVLSAAQSWLRSAEVCSA
jgi:lipopolysaccharide heptosyltransferase II